MDDKKLGKRGTKMELTMNSKFEEMNEQEMMAVDGGMLTAIAGAVGMYFVEAGIQAITGKSATDHLASAMRRTYCFERASKAQLIPRRPRSVPNR